jgi:hypothetical protein
VNASRFQSRIGEVLSAGCAVLVFVAMYDHMMAIKYIDLGMLTVLAAACMTLSLLRSPREFRPILVPLGLWATWTLTSTQWSVDGSTSTHAWLDEVVYPLTGFYVFWLTAQHPQRAQRIQSALWIACLILAGASIAYFQLLDPALPKPGLLHFYPRVGHTSTLALMAIPVFAAMALSGNAKMRGLTGVCFCIIIGGATLNRFFWVALAVMAVILLWPQTRATRKRSAITLGAVFVAIALAVVFGNTLRLETVIGPLSTPHDTIVAKTKPETGGIPPLGTVVSTATPVLAKKTSATTSPEGIKTSVTVVRQAERALANDTRPQIWRFYSSQVPKHLWRGIGFGKSLPSIAYGKLIPASLVELDQNVRTHAHNLFLNTLLQVGVVGLFLQMAVFASLVYRFYLVRQTHPIICRAGIALVLGMLTKNLTDDFMWESTMLMFWCLCGLLMGQCRKTAIAQEPAVPHNLPALAAIDCL